MKDDYNPLKIDHGHGDGISMHGVGDGISDDYEALIEVFGEGISTEEG